MEENKNTNGTENQNNDQTGQNDQNTGNNVGSNNQDSTGKNEETKTFTQDEVNDIVEKRLAKEKKKMPSDKEMEEFKTWKASQKTEEEKAREKDERIAALEKQIADGEHMESIRNADVDKSFQKFVLSEVSSKDGDFDKNLQDYLKENPQYVKKGNSSTGMPMNGSGSGDEDDGATAILKKKHPELFK